MTVPASPRKAGPFPGDGSNKSFPFTFKVFSTADLKVVKADVNGVESTLVLDSDYSVALNPDQDATPGGTITYPISGSAMPSTESLAASGDLSYEQSTDIITGGDFDPNVLENTLDRIVMQVQQLDEQVARSAKLPITQGGDAAALVADIVLLADNAASLAALAGGIVAVQTVATNISSVNTVASINTAVSTVAAIAANVTAVAGNSANINSVAGNSANINTVAGNSANINTVAGVSGNVTTVATNIAAVTTAATNIAAIIAAPAQAAAAASSASAAATSASDAAASAAAAALSAANLPNATTGGANKILTTNPAGNAFEYDAIPNGLVKGNGSALSAASAGTDYVAPGTASNFTAPQRSAILTDNDLSFDLSAKQNFKCTPTAGGTLTFTNPADGLSGYIILVNGSNYAIAAAATTKISAAALARISASGTYRLDYASDGTNTYVTASESLA